MWNLFTINRLFEKQAISHEDYIMNKKNCSEILKNSDKFFFIHDSTNLTTFHVF